MPLPPIHLIAILFLLGLGIAVLLRLFTVSWGKALGIGLIGLPLALLAGAWLTYAMVIVIKQLELEVGGLVFLGLATLTVGSAIGVATSRSILYSGFFLLGTLSGVAGLYLFIGADFVGIAQLLIYIGGILVLILFAVLLTNQIGLVEVTNKSVHRGLGAVAALGVFLLTALVGLGTPWAQVEAVATPTTARLGDAFLREYLLPFELISVVLLMALVGAMVIARHAAKDQAAARRDAPGLDRLE